MTNGRAIMRESFLLRAGRCLCFRTDERYRRLCTSVRAVTRL